MCICIFNGIMWFDMLLLEYVEGEGIEQYFIVQVIMKLIQILKFEYYIVCQGML